MHSLTIAVGPTVWSLLFNSDKTAQTQREAVRTALATNAATCNIRDDFGQELEVQMTSLHGFMFENMDETKLAHCERMLHQARLQGHAQRLAEQDPGLRMASQMRGPAIISPMGNGRG